MSADRPTGSAAFRWFFAGRAVDLAGGAMTPVALALAVLQASGSATHLGVVMASAMVPTLVLMVLGGTLADRMSRRSLLVASALASAVVQGATAAVLIAGRYQLGVLVALSVLNGAVGAFAGPALRGIVPELVPADGLQRANAALASVRNATRIGGPVLAGLLVATVGGGWALAVDALSFAVAAFCFAQLPPSGRPRPDQGLRADLARGWTEFASRRWLVQLSLSYAVLNALMVGPWQVLGPLIVREHDGAVGWGAVLSVRAVGLLLASLALLRLTIRRPVTTGRLVGALSGLSLLALGFSGDAVAVAAAALLGGVGMTVGNLTYETVLQSRIPTAVISRVSAYDDLLAYLAIPVSQLAVGPAAAAFGAQRVALGCGLAYVVVSVLPLASASVRALDAPGRPA